MQDWPEWPVYAKEKDNFCCNIIADDFFDSPFSDLRFYEDSFSL